MRFIKYTGAALTFCAVIAFAGPAMAQSGPGVPPITDPSGSGTTDAGAGGAASSNATPQQVIAQLQQAASQMEAHLASSPGMDAGQRAAMQADIDQIRQTIQQMQQEIANSSGGSGGGSGSGSGGSTDGLAGGVAGVTDVVNGGSGAAGSGDAGSGDAGSGDAGSEDPGLMDKINNLLDKVPDSVWDFLGQLAGSFLDGLLNGDGGSGSEDGLGGIEDGTDVINGDGSGTDVPDTGGGLGGDTGTGTGTGGSLPIDTNGDGIPDAVDTNGDGTPDAFDTDGDGAVDSFDSDGDGQPDGNGSTTGGTGTTGGVDTDGDGVIDAFDTDGDGQPDVFDTDGDGSADAFDTDGDGQPDGTNVNDGAGGNPMDTNGDGQPDAVDTDGDGQPDAFDTDGDGAVDSFDTDGDGQPDTTTTGGTGNSTVGTPVDTNGDGTPDGFDRDGDGQPDLFDTNGDGTPDSFDSDGDGVADAKDTDGDGRPDSFDTDGDGVLDTGPGAGTSVGGPGSPSGNNPQDGLAQFGEEGDPQTGKDPADFDPNNPNGAAGVAGGTPGAGANDGTQANANGERSQDDLKKDLKTVTGHVILLRKVGSEDLGLSGQASEEDFLEDFSAPVDVKENEEVSQERILDDVIRIETTLDQWRKKAAGGSDSQIQGLAKENSDLPRTADGQIDFSKVEIWLITGWDGSTPKRFRLNFPLEANFFPEPGAKVAVRGVITPVALPAGILDEIGGSVENLEFDSVVASAASGAGAQAEDPFAEIDTGDTDTAPDLGDD